MRVRHPLVAGAALVVVACAAGLGTGCLHSRINIFRLAFQPTELTEDFDILRQALEEAHPGLYRYTSKTDLDRLFAHARSQLNNRMTAVEFYRLLAPVIAQIRCGHTILRPAPTLEGELFGGDKIFPFGVRIRSGKVHIFDDFATPNKSLAGAEVLSINGVSTSKILAVMLAATSGDGNIVTGKANLIGRGRGGGFFRALFSPMLFAVLGLKEPFTVVY